MEQKTSSPNLFICYRYVVLCVFVSINTKNPYDLFAKQNGSIFSCKKLPYFQMIHFMRILLWAAYFWIREQSSDRIKTLAIYSEKPKKCQGKWAMEVWSCEFVWLWLRFFSLSCYAVYCFTLIFTIFRVCGMARPVAKSSYFPWAK